MVSIERSSVVEIIKNWHTKLWKTKGLGIKGYKCCKVPWLFLSMVITRDGPDSSFAGYPAILKTGFRISGRISGGCRIPDIRPNILPDTGYFRHMMNYMKILWKSCIVLSKQELENRSKGSIDFSLYLLSEDKNM